MTTEEALREERRAFLMAVQGISLGFTEHTHGDEDLSVVDATVQGICNAIERWIRERMGEQS